jgi:MFS transporter, DHA1 family, multidrug resistance protein
MLDIFRDSAFGTVLNYLSGGRILPFRDQLPGYQIPERYLLRPDDASNPVTRVPSTTNDEKRPVSASDPEAQTGKQEGIVAAPIDPYLVDWDGDDDQDNPL